MKEYVKQPGNRAGAPGKEPQAQKQAPLGELIRTYSNNAPVQRAAAGAGGREDAGEELNAVLENLETVVMQAMQMPGPEAEKKDAFELAERLRELRVIAGGNNEEVKSAVLEELKKEMEMAGSPPVPGNTPPVQRMKDWQKALIGTAAVIGLGTLLYKLYKNITNRPEEAEEDLPDNDMQEDEAPGIDIPAELTEGITDDMSVEEKANRIFENVNNFEFNYNGWYYPVQMSMESHAGDCQSLVEIYELVASRFGVPTVRDNIRTHMLVNRAPIHGRPALGNTEGETAWSFQEHYWIIAADTPYDVLFMISPPPVPVLEVGTGIHNGVNYRIFADDRVLIKPRQEAVWSYPVQGQGLVLANVAAAQDFIAAHPPKIIP